jgi:radical SAM protein with 4Fe4S-binding SPASM domain
MLSYENAKAIIDQFPGLVHLNLSLWGEPLLNKDIFRIIKFAKSKDIDVLLQSNLNIMDESSAAEMIHSDLDVLQISLDGASQETYEKYRVRGNFNKVIEHIKLLKTIQKNENNHHTKIVWKMVVNKFNELEVDKAKEMAEELGVEFKIVEIYTPAALAKEWKPAKAIEKSSIVHTDIVEKCYSLWQVATINFNGDVFPCCSEFSPVDAIGNVFTQNFKDIWNNSKYTELRERNKKSVNCKACHKDQATNWYKLWMS